MKFSAKISLVLCSILILSCFTIFLEPTEARTSTLRTSGSRILDSSNHQVILRGIGRTGDLESASGMWSDAGDPNVVAWGQKWLPISTNVPLMDATFRCYQQVWHVNMIRVFILPSWYWQNNIVPAQQDPQNYGGWTTPISYRTYIRTLVAEAQKYGIYVDIVPYQLVSNYQDGNKGGDQGLPMTGWDIPCQAFLNSTRLSERNFWKQFWTLMANNLRGYNNVIFEAWNEPAHTGNDPILSSYLSYLSIMYSAVRGTGAKNLILMQWNSGYIPTYNDLSWCAQIRSAIPRASNLAFTTHAYRHAPYFNSQWGTNYTVVLSQVQAAVRSMGVTVPLLINEAGSCMAYVAANDTANELGWWDALNRAAYSLKIGLTAYYWMSDTDLGPIYAGETLLSGPWAAGTASPPRNNVGQIFLSYTTGVPTRASPHFG